MDVCQQCQRGLRLYMYERRHAQRPQPACTTAAAPFSFWIVLRQSINLSGLVLIQLRGGHFFSGAGDEEAADDDTGIMSDQQRELDCGWR
jgi:hypothetical protein